MSSLRPLLRYWFYPNPGLAAYGDAWVIWLLVLCGALVALGITLRIWRRRLMNPVLRKLSKSWPTISLALGITGAVLVVCRVERIQFLAMRFLWILWLLAGLFALVLHVRLYRLRFYEVLPAARAQDPREKYLPTPKRK